TDLATIGDPTLLTKAMRDAEPTEIARVFGHEFTKELFDLPTKEWAGPVKSGFGFHLVYIVQLIPGSAPSLTEVRKAVEGEWLAEQRKIANQRFFKILQDRYTVEIYDDGSYGNDEKAKLQ
ncbi:MAG: peptidyl-prolyl cis-trans isomerase, partial [Hyphomicrobiales bacterium]|nr:peptidyl-prolyl cis-trans isomerase [Hyphomicrobiales bacterium]